ncbi:MAG: AAA family ATPase [Gammaproteobacteria bacterium]|nr:AAA family ATPase [Boseongicola sp. SB0665_bin_10]MYG66647.1 AAA family ATPase [Gammaproteobacteria bacterium]
MRVVHLKLANVRAIEAAEFHFGPGFNLVAGVNGVGKTTVLDALAVCLSAIVGRAGASRWGAMSFGADDIRKDVGALQLECGFEIAGEIETFMLHRPRESVVVPKGMDQFDRGETALTANTTPTIEDFFPGMPVEGEARPSESQPLAVLFSTNRAVPSERTPKKSVATGGVNAAYPDALSNRRELRLSDFAAWMRVQKALSSERPAVMRVLIAFEAAVRRFLPGYRNFRVGDVGKRGSSLLIDRGDVTLPIKSLSDGERGVLALVLDLTRRLAQANPEMDDPAAEAEAVVLIDEIELHLHPRWQRKIVENLTETFPNCQFIATTHSPQVIGEVEHNRIHMIVDGKVYPLNHSFGVDSSRLLEEVMDTDSRTVSIKKLLSNISEAITDDRYDEAHKLLDDLSSQLGDTDPEVTRIQTLLDFMKDDG